MYTLKAQLKSLIHYVPAQYLYWKQMWEWRRKYGAPRSIKCKGSYCWVLIWEPAGGGDDSVEHVSFDVAKALAPRLDCFIYQARCGCTRRLWGPLLYVDGKCEKHGFHRAR